MKNLTLAATLLILATSAAEAHDLAPDTIMFSGDTTFDDSSSEFRIGSFGTNEKTDTTVFNVVGSYFVAQNLAVGLMINNEDSKTSDSIGMTNINSSMNMIGPLVNYNISLNTNFSVILTAGMFTASGDIDDGMGSSANIDGDGTLLMASMAYFMSDNIAVTFGVRKLDLDVDITMAGIPDSADISETAFAVGFAVFF